MSCEKITVFLCCLVLLFPHVFAKKTSKVFIPLSKKDFVGPADCGRPLFLTPYIRSGNIQEAKYFSLVGKLPNAPKVTSHSGFITVNEKYNSNIFFWFFPAMNNDPDAPILLWLQGGPGTSGLFGLFVEHGPFVIDSNMTAKIRPYHWAQTFHVIYVDNPVGAGFSFTDSDYGYVTNQESVARDLFKFLQQFFKMFHEYRNNDFYITGESYAGKYVPSLAYKIHREGSSAKFNFKGIAIGNGLCDPENMLDYSPYLYQLGLIDRKQADIMLNLSNSIRKHIHLKEYYEALIEMDKLIIDFNVLPYTSFFKNYTDYKFLYNYLRTEEPKDFTYFESYIRSPKFRKAVHVGNLTYQNGGMAQTNLLLDIMQSVKPEVTVIMNNYRVLFYSGQMDLIIPYPLTINFLSNVRWKNATAYKNVERQIWKVDGTDRIAGYVHNVGDFFEILVRDAGHIVPYDQPRAALDMITRFIKQRPYA